MSIAPTVGVVRSTTGRDLGDVEQLLAADPIAHCFVSSRVRAGGVDPWRIGGDLLGYDEGGRLRSLVYLGANLIPVATSPTSRVAFATRLAAMPRRCSSLVGPAEEVLDLWRLLEPSWGPAREIRSDQRLLVIDHAPVVAPDPLVRRATAADLDLLVPACVAMFTAEVGVSPLADGMGAAYRARVGELVREGRSFVRIEDGVVVFKAEIGAATPQACQVQGVWVDPSRRGRGLSETGMAAVVDVARRQVSPTVSLYVNSYNVAARRSYRSVGFRAHSTFATVLL